MSANSYVPLMGLGASICTLFAGAVVLFFRDRTAASLLQLCGAGCLIVVMLTHAAEALHLFPSMGWGIPQSAGHYVDLSSAVLGLALFPAGYLCHALGMQRSGHAG